MPVEEMIISEIQKTSITLEVTYRRGVSWGRSTSTIDDSPVQQEEDVQREENASPVAVCA